MRRARRGVQTGGEAVEFVQCCQLPSAAEEDGEHSGRGDCDGGDRGCRGRADRPHEDGGDGRPGERRRADAALDAYEAEQFWAAAEAAATAETPDERAERKRVEADVDARMDRSP